MCYANFYLYYILYLSSTYPLPKFYLSSTNSSVISYQFESHKRGEVKAHTR